MIIDFQIWYNSFTKICRRILCDDMNFYVEVKMMCLTHKIPASHSIIEWVNLLLPGDMHLFLWFAEWVSCWNKDMNVHKLNISRRQISSYCFWIRYWQKTVGGKFISISIINNIQAFFSIYCLKNRKLYDL